MATTLALMVADLKTKSQVQVSEGYADAFLESIVIGAGRKHNPNYAISSATCTVPDLEADLVVLLAWSDLCYVRASAFAASPGATQQGFGTNRDTPYYKLTNLADLLLKRYQEVCASLGLTTFYGAGSPTMSEVTCESLDLGAQAPVEISITPTAPVLSAATSVVQPDGTIVLNWTCKDFNNFAAFAIVTMSGAESILQMWNFASASGIPGIHDSAQVVTNISQSALRSVKLQGLQINSGTVNRFVVVTITRSGKYAYSNEVVTTQP
jgi:hypothetical protein